jgi:four helix bundle protein
MGSVRTFRDLIVWRKAVDLAKAVYQATRAMPETERFGLIAQMRRAAVSVPSNIAEGNARHTLKDYIHFLSVARGSLAELETQITIARELNMLNDPHPLVDLLSETDRLLQGLIRSLQDKRKRSGPS